MEHRWRSVLFAPANRPELVTKLHRAGPDVAVLDLEDAVPADGKAAARPLARDGAAALAALADGAGPAVYVRVNAVRSDWFAPDVRAVAAPGVTGLVVPKLESVDDVDAVTAVTASVAGAPTAIVAGIETARGVADARAILAHRAVVACYFGAEDFTADMGGGRRPDNAEVLVARSLVVLAARLGGIPALDIVVTDFQDDERFTREALEARAMGYAGKLCIHPRQVPLARSAFTPSADDVERARQLLAAYERAGGQVVSFEGQMVDEPLAARARAVLAAADDVTPASAAPSMRHAADSSSATPSGRAQR
jgi:citrate lyase subunit beta/citryl-CoA lyase